VGGVPVITISERGLAWLAAAWEGFPAQALVMIGVTGTDGKTSVVNLLFPILQAAGLKVGMISTIKAVFGNEEEPTGLHVTTPEAPAVQRYLRRMVNAGISHVILETTSHGWAQYRTGAIHFDIGIVSNIQHEHLDYHGSWEGYLRAKARLFESLKLPLPNLPIGSAKAKIQYRVAVLNRDDLSYPHLQPIAGREMIDYGIQNPANVMANNIEYTASDTSFAITMHRKLYQYAEGDPIPPAPPRPIKISSELVGEFNVYNMLAAATAAHALDLPHGAIKKGLESVKAISGRMQRIDEGQHFMVVVDFAHTPNALVQAIVAARGMTDGRVITVFGSAGKRDVQKRRIMAETSARDADLTILTAEDPRTESLDDILAMMAEGAASQGGVEGQTFWRMPDRGEAIYFALGLATQPNDLVLICGKGHEQSMNFAGTEYPWDDRDATRSALKAFISNQPMPDLGLPTFGKNMLR
jgi:UDP-N-acetylmuramoyl-L-alanyl-D-glutamate--2,6-diaminopimelate ligase